MSEEMATDQGTRDGSNTVMVLSMAAGAAIGFAVGYGWWWISGTWTELGWGAVGMVLGAGVGMMIGRMTSKQT